MKRKPGKIKKRKENVVICKVTKGLDLTGREQDKAVVKLLPSP